MITFTDFHGHTVRESLSQWVDGPVYDRDLAAKIARRIAEALRERVKEAQLRQMMGLPQKHRLHELLTEYHSSKRARKWSKRHRNEQEEWRQLWLDALGPGTWLHKVNAHDVELIVMIELGNQSNSRQKKCLGYLKATFNYAEKKLKWIDPRHNLSAVQLPSVEPNKGHAYTDEELVRLLPAMRKVDLRCGFLGDVMDYCARRLNAVKHLRVEDYRKESIQLRGGEYQEVGILTFRSRYDKAKKSAEIPLSPRGTEIIEELLETRAVKATGLLFPTGDLDDPKDHMISRGKKVSRSVIDHSRLIEMLHDAEKEAGVEYIKGRAYHGIKRRVVTSASDNRIPVEVMAALSGTSVETLQRQYNKLSRDVAALLRWGIKAQEEKKKGS